MSLLEVRGLSVSFNGAKVVDDISLDLGAGEVLGLVGESGSGKSVSMLALMGLLEPTARVTAERLDFDGTDLRSLSGPARRALLGREIAMVFQDASSSLNPSMTIGQQVAEPLKIHLGLRGSVLRRRALELLEQVEIPDAVRRYDAWPHELSGGMNQRVMIAMAIACGPRLLIADEPTTALDVTIQAQIMRLLRRLQSERGMSLLLITHDLAVVAETAARTAIMYAGRIVETGRLPGLFESPHHPYTAALLAALPERSRGNARLAAVAGRVPAPHERGAGCTFAPRCPRADAACDSPPPWQLFGAAAARCFHPHDAPGMSQ